MEPLNRWFIGAVVVCMVAAVAGFAYFGYLDSQPCALVENPSCNIPASLTIVAAWINSPTSITLELHNSGQQLLNFSSYYVKDMTGNLYSALRWNGPSFPANANLNITLTIDGKNFAFQPGNSYQVTIQTLQGYAETFSAKV